MGACYKCNHPFPETGKALAQDAVCERCSSWLHCCANCLHFDEYSKKHCREPRAAYVHDRHVHNQCAFFKVRRLMQEDAHKKNGKQDRNERFKANRARENLEKLFKS